jgi:hypothetical protein
MIFSTGIKSTLCFLNVTAKVLVQYVSDVLGNNLKFFQSADSCLNTSTNFFIPPPIIEA